MKKLKLLLFAIIMMIPFYSVNAIELIGYLPDTIVTNEMITFNKYNDIYETTVDGLTSELNFTFSIEGFQIDGAGKILCEDGITKQYFRVYKLSTADQVCDPNICEYQLVTFVVYKLNSDGDSAMIKDLKISGTSFVFNSDITSYTVKVPSSTKEVYIDAETFGPSTEVEGAGFVKLTGSKTNVKLTTKNELLGNVEYNIVIKRGLGNVLYIIIIVLLSIAFIGYVIINNLNKRVTLNTVSSEFGEGSVDKGIVINTAKPIPVEENQSEVTTEEVATTEVPTTDEVVDTTPVIEDTPEEITKGQTIDLSTTVKPIAVEDVKEEAKAEESKESTPDTNEVDPIINTSLLSNGIEPRTMIVSDEEK